MGFDWTSIENSFPVFREDESPQVIARKLHDYLFLLVKQLGYTLQNLDTGNWNKVALRNFSTETTKGVAEQMEKQAASLDKTTKDFKTWTADQEGQLTATQTAVAYLQALAGGTSDDLKAVCQVVESLAYDVAELMDRVAELELLQQEMAELRNSVENLTEAVQAGAESVAVGVKDLPLYLNGTVYINGVEYTEGG